MESVGCLLEVVGQAGDVPGPVQGHPPLMLLTSSLMLQIRIFKQPSRSEFRKATITEYSTPAFGHFSRHSDLATDPHCLNAAPRHRIQH